MAAKKPLFHVAEWERKQKQQAGARKSAEKKLADAVRRYNDKIDREVKSGRLTKETAPERLTVREIKKQIPAGLSPLQRGAALSRAAQQIGKRQKADFAKVTTEGGVEMPRGVLERAKNLYEKSKRKQAEEEAKRQAAEAAAPKFGGVTVTPPRKWGEGAVPGNPETAKTWEKFEERVEAALKYTRAGEWEVYRQDLLKNYEKHYTGEKLDAMKNALKKLTNEQLEAAFRAGAEFAEQGYHYESEARAKVDSMVENMERWAKT